jgi:hypothetical protein
MAKRPGVSATFHIIAVKDQHCLLYIKHKANATLITNLLCFEHFSYYNEANVRFQENIRILLISFYSGLFVYCLFAFTSGI